MSAGFKDHFSSHAAGYRAARPTYPAALFAWLAEQAPARGVTVDLGCGNGQASCGLAEHFTIVHARDPSAEQIRQAEPHPCIDYAVAAAEATGLPDACADVVLAAQAFHWFDHARFFPELMRILKPNGLFAAVAYTTCTITPAVDAMVQVLYHELLGAFWPPERRHVEDGYRSLPFPLRTVVAPAMDLIMEWDLAQLDAYLGTWSALVAWQRQHGSDPRERIRSALQQAWGDPSAVRRVCWPLVIRAGRP